MRAYLVQVTYSYRSRSRTQAKLSGGAEINAAHQQQSGTDDSAATAPVTLTEDSAEASLRSMWPLVFSRDEPVREAVVDAMYNLYLKDGEGE